MIQFFCYNFVIVFTLQFLLKFFCNYYATILYTFSFKFPFSLKVWLTMTNLELSLSPTSVKNLYFCIWASFQALCKYIYRIKPLCTVDVSNYLSTSYLFFFPPVNLIQCAQWYNVTLNCHIAETWHAHNLRACVTWCMRHKMKRH